MQNIVYMQAEMNSVDAELRINDIPVFRSSSLNRISGSIPISEYVLRSKNTLAVKVDRGSDTFSDRLAAVDHVHIRVAEFYEGELMTPESGLQLAQLRSPTPENAILPFDLVAFFDYEQGRDWPWASASRIDLAARRSEIVAFVDYMAQLFRQRNIDEMLRMYELVVRQNAQAYPAISLQDRYENFPSRFLTGSGAWSPIQFDPDHIELRPIAEGLMVEILRDGLPAIRTESNNVNNPWTDPDYVELPLRLGYRQGILGILR